jgi:hypothetical protein
LLWAGGFVVVVVVVGFVVVVVGFATRRVAALLQRVSERDREREYSTCTHVYLEREREDSTCTHMNLERERERETENDNVRKRRELQRTHTRTRARQSALRHVAQRPGRCHEKQTPPRGGRAAAQRPVRKLAAGRGSEAASSFEGPRINRVRAREKVNATRKCRGEAREREQRVEFNFL